MASPENILRQAMPVSVPGWAAVLLAALLIPRLTNATAILIFLGFLGFILTLPRAVSPTLRARFSASPWPLRALPAACLLYVAFVLIGYSTELFSLRHALDYLFLREATPVTGVHQGAVAASLTLFLAYFVSRPKDKSLPKPPPDHERVLKGGYLITQEQASAIARSRAGAGEQLLDWAGVPFPESLSCYHFAVIGGPGTGKTLLLKLLMRSVFSAMKPGGNRRAIVYDAKQDAMELLAGMSPALPVRTLNPFAPQGVAWDIAADITTPSHAQEAATLLIPEQTSKGDFFGPSAHLLIEAAMCAFLEHAPGKWTLRDLLLALRYTARMRALVALSEHSAYLLDKFMSDTRTDKNIDQTVELAMRPLATVAAAWEMAGERMSLASFLEGESILVLGTSELDRTVLSNINRVLFMCLARHILTGPENSGRRTWVFVDELRDAGALNDLARVMLKGRSKGAAVVLGIQDLPSLQHVYTPQVAGSLIGAAASKVFLANPEGETLKYASEHFKTQEIERVSYTYNWGWNRSTKSNPTNHSKTDSKGYTASRSKVVQPVVPESLLKALKIPDSANLSFEGYCDTLPVGAHRPYKMEIPDAQVRALLEKEERVRAGEGTPAASRIVGALREWDMQDLERLNLSHSPELLRDFLPQPRSERPPKPRAPQEGGAPDAGKNPLLDL